MQSSTGLETPKSEANRVQRYFAKLRYAEKVLIAMKYIQTSFVRASCLHSGNQ